MSRCGNEGGVGCGVNDEAGGDGDAGALGIFMFIYVQQW